MNVFSFDGGGTLWAEQYLGIPYAERGMTRKGCNCWGLVRLVLADQAGVTMPEYGDMSVHQIGQVARGVIPVDVVAEWSILPAIEVRALDVALMRGTNRLHCGIMVSPELILHVEAHTDSVIVPRAHFSVAPRIVGFYRHKSRIGFAA